MIYTIEKQGAHWLLKSAPSENDAPARLGAYKTRLSAITVARVLLGARSTLSIENENHIWKIRRVK